MVWPVEPDSVLSSAQLVSEWDESGEGEGEIRDTLNTLTIDQGRAVVMARPDEFQRVFGAEGKSLDWETEPWYGTKYLVERFDEDFASRVRTDSIRCATVSKPLFRLGGRTTYRNCIFRSGTNSSQRIWASTSGMSHSPQSALI